MDTVTQAPNERPHHPFSPSTLQYRESCPYYQPTSGDNAASRAGTLQHEATDAGEDNERLSDQQADAVADCLAYVDSVAKKYPGGTVIKEEYLPVDHLTIDFLSWEGKPETMLGTTAGYVDYAIVSKCGKFAELIDYKFGQWAVEPSENNLQGMAYLRGLLVRYPGLEEVTVHFCMPHRDEIEFHTFKRAEFTKIYQRIRTVVMRAIEARKEQDFSKATPNIGACLFCANAGRCDALAKIALQIGHKFSPVQIPETITPTLLRDPKEVGAGMKVASVIEAWAKAYRAQASAKAIEEDGVVPEGYQLIASSDRKIIDPKKLREVCRTFGLTDDEIDSASKFHITPIDELIRAKTARGQKDSAAKALSDALITAGAVEMGAETAFLRMSRKKKTD